MLTALKFVAAGVILALFGGFLLAGVLTTPRADEMAPAAVTESPEPEAKTAPKEPTEPPDPSVRTDILPGIALAVEEVEPGVYRVGNDGVRDLVYQREPTAIGLSFPDIHTGEDDGIWVLHRDGYYRLGVKGVRISRGTCKEPIEWISRLGSGIRRYLDGRLRSVTTGFRHQAGRGAAGIPGIDPMRDDTAMLRDVGWWARK